MRLRQVGVNLIEESDHGQDVDGVFVFLPSGWYARLLLADVSADELTQLQILFDTHRRLYWFRYDDRVAEYRDHWTAIIVNDPEYINSFIYHGALWDRRVMHELGQGLLQRLLQQLQ